MAEKSKRLKREAGTVGPREGRRWRRDDDDDDRRLARDDDDDDRDRDERHDDDDERPRQRRRRRRPRGRPPLTDEVKDLNRGAAFVMAESVAMGLNIASRVLRNAVDRAFDEDYNEPGDVVRGLTDEADLAAYDVVDELRRVPRRLDRRFEDAIRSPRADRGERARRRND